MVTSSERTRPLTFLRRVLGADAVVTAGNGVIYLLASGPVERLLGVPSSLLAGIGAFLVGYGLAVGYLATRQDPAGAAVRAVVIANGCWVVASLAVLASGWLELTSVGVAWIPLQAAVVGGFAALQAVGLRRCRVAA